MKLSLSIAVFILALPFGASAQPCRGLDPDLLKAATSGPVYDPMAGAAKRQEIERGKLELKLAAQAIQLNQLKLQQQQLALNEQRIHPQSPKSVTLDSELKDTKRVDQDLYRFGDVFVQTNFCFYDTDGGQAVLKYVGSGLFSGSRITFKNGNSCDVVKVALLQ
jgi:hypothetical protein